MKTKLSFAIFFSVLLLAASTANAAILISDLSIGGSTGHADNEFILLSNDTAVPFPLDGFKIIQSKFSESKSSCSDETLVPTEKLSGKYIPPEGIFLIAHPGYEGAAAVDVFYAKSNHLVSSTMSVALIDGHGTEIARKDIGTKCDPLPEEPPEDPAAPPDDPNTPITIRLSEILPNPKKGGKEFVELYNSGPDKISLEGWELRDKGSHITLTGSIETGVYLIPEKSDALSLNDSGGNTITLKNAKKIVIDEVSYNKTKDGISLNYTPAGWRGGTPTPGAANILNNLPTTKEKVPKKGFKGMPIAMSAKGKDADKDKLKYTWDFGDGHKSYKQETSHTYEKNGEYAVTLTVSDGSDDTIETFTIKIVSYEPPDVHIVSFVPNPDGTDTDSEWILIENREKKKSADLKGFGVATGWKKLANHPIRESFVIPPKSSATLTRAYSLFTLPNQKGKIELRAPDGDVLQEIKYKLEKSAPEDAVYMKKKGERWKLTVGQQKPKNNQQLTTNSQQEAEDGQQSAINSQQETPSDEPSPVEESAPEPETPAVIRNDEMTKDPDQPKLSDLLSYGLSLHLPKAVAYVPHDEVSVTPAAPEPKVEESSVDTLFVRINTLINAWLNGI